MWPHPVSWGARPELHNPAALPPGYDPAAQLYRYAAMQQQLAEQAAAARRRSLEPIRSHSFSDAPHARAFSSFGQLQAQPIPSHLLFNHPHALPSAPSFPQPVPGHQMLYSHPAVVPGIAHPAHWPSLAALAAAPPPPPPLAAPQHAPAANQLQLSARTLPESMPDYGSERRELRRGRRHRHRRSPSKDLTAVQLLAGVLQQLALPKAHRGRRRDRHSSSSSSRSSSRSKSTNSSEAKLKGSVKGGDHIRQGKAARRLQRWWRSKKWQSRDVIFREGQQKMREDRNITIFTIDFVHETLRTLFLPEICQQSILEVSLEQERAKQYSDLLSGALDDLLDDCIPHELRGAVNLAISELVNSHFYQKLTAVISHEESYMEEFVTECMRPLLTTLARECIMDMAEKHMQSEWVDFLTLEFIEPILYKVAKDAFQEALAEDVLAFIIEETVQQECRSISIEVSSAFQSLLFGERNAEELELLENKASHLFIDNALLDALVATISNHAETVMVEELEDVMLNAMLGELLAAKAHSTHQHERRLNDGIFADFSMHMAHRAVSDHLVSLLVRQLAG